MINDFQKRLLKDKVLVQEIVNVMCEGVEIPEHIYHVGTKYDWVTISSKTGIDFAMKFDTPFWGNKIKLKDFQEAYKEDTFKIWRFVTDSSYKEGKRNLTKLEEYSFKKLMKVYNVEKPTPEQMYKYYYED